MSYFYLDIKKRDWNITSYWSRKAYI